jgi:hypothetical protein
MITMFSALLLPAAYLIRMMERSGCEMAPSAKVGFVLAV